MIRPTPDQALDPRFSRQLLLSGFSAEAQKRIAAASVLVIGCGGLAHPAITYLCTAGIGRLVLVDDDLVSRSNLHRQFLFGPSDEGRQKAEVAGERLAALNDKTTVDVHTLRADAHSVRTLMEGCDVVIDASDNFATRLLVDEACAALRKPLVYGAADGWEGQLTVLHVPAVSGGTGIGLADLFPELPDDSGGNCSTNGVWPLVPGMIGMLQANEALKLIAGVGEVLSGQWLLFDARDSSFRTIRIPQRQHHREDPSLIRSITPGELMDLRLSGTPHLLFDVREPWEREQFSIGGESIPMGDVPLHAERFRSDHPVVVVCKAGVRSAQVIRYLQHEHGMRNLLNLHGGLLAWIEAHSGIQEARP